MRFCISALLSSVTVSALMGCQPTTGPDPDSVVIELLPNKTYSELLSEIESKQTVFLHEGSTALKNCLETISSSVPSSPQLTLWINSDKGYNGLQKVANCYTQDSGISIAVETPDNVTENFQQQTAAGGGPDIFIWAHDRIGDWAENGFLVALSPPEDIQNSIEKSLWTSTTYEGQVYGYPLSIEGATMLVNTDLISQNTVDLKRFSKGKAAPLLWDYNNTYFTYPWLNATGGYAFKQTSTGWDKTDVGVDRQEVIEQAELLKQLIDDGVIEQGVDYGVMDQRFKQGDVAMILNGPWSWADYEQAGINFEVRGYRINGHDPRPFSGVLSATVNANSTNQVAAIAFIENYLTTKAGMSTVNDDRAIGVPTNLSFLGDFANDDYLMGLATAMTHSEPMPNIPEMGDFWSNMGPALTAITQGRQSATEALTDAAQRIR